MMLLDWERLPNSMQNDAVQPYYDALSKKKVSLFCKRVFDFIVALVLLIVLLPIFLLLALLIKLDSPGAVMFRQVRVTRYGKEFRIYKFRTMVQNAEKLGTQVTSKNDARVTRIGGFLRKFRLDELPQLINIMLGDMSFVGTRPEVPRYVKQYTDEMLATLLLPAGVTSEASIRYKDEDKLLTDAEDADKTYVEQILPQKMQYNLHSLLEFGFANDLKTMINTVTAIFS